MLDKPANTTSANIRNKTSAAAENTKTP